MPVHYFFCVYELYDAANVFIVQIVSLFSQWCSLLVNKFQRWFLRICYFYNSFTFFNKTSRSIRWVIFYLYVNCSSFSFVFLPLNLWKYCEQLTFRALVITVVQSSCSICFLLLYWWVSNFVSIKTSTILRTILDYIVVHTFALIMRCRQSFFVFIISFFSVWSTLSVNNSSKRFRWIDCFCHCVMFSYQLSRWIRWVILYFYY